MPRSKRAVKIKHRTPAPRIKVEKRQRSKAVHVKGHCRRPATFADRFLKRDDIPF